MNIKEITIRQLLTTTDTYAGIVETIKEAHPTAQSTVKCVAFYAHQLRKIDKNCLSHRKTAQSKESNLAALIAKYATCPQDEAETVGEELDEAVAENENDAEAIPMEIEVAEVEVVEVVEPKPKRIRRAA